ncbi:variable surface lipoprotein [Toxoplasma gondii VAND]|uniref:Variable surface lipoprotein n=2 Tax=Toxoplasma gondii TaxID=5811 RepID=A0A086PQT3_TOXGO|nr:variable surface lipoprotein [Toxoplasma gondii VAND]
MAVPGPMGMPGPPAMGMPGPPAMGLPPGGPYGVNPTLRPPPQVVEQMLDELEEKARHYFILYNREKKAREKTERYSFWLQKELAEHKEKLLKSADYIESLQNKFDELRGDPEMIRDTLQRIDLMYAQVDTLVQALAGVCGFAAVKDSTREQLLQCALDYLYPCRALDPRLHELYGVLYYFRLGESKSPPGIPPPPPEPSYVPLSEGVGGPWIKPSPYTLFLNPAAGLSMFQRNMAETQKAVEAEEAEKAGKADAEQKKETTKRIFGATVQSSGTSKAKVGTAKPAGTKTSTETAKTASDPPKREPVDPKATLKGFSLFVRKLEEFKRPASSKVESLRIVVRTDDESATDSKKKEGRSMLIEKCGGSPGKEEATFNLLVEFPSLPAKKAGGNPKIVIDVYDNKAFAALGRADKPFNDKSLGTEDAVWEIKDNTGKAFGKLVCTVTPLPLNAPLPCEGGGGEKDAGAAKKGGAETKEAVKKEAKKEEAKPGAIKKPELPKLAVTKPDLPKPGGPGASVPSGEKKAGEEAKSKPGPPPLNIKKPDLPAPAKTAPTKEGIKAGDDAKKSLDIKKPPLDLKSGDAGAPKKELGASGPDLAAKKPPGGGDSASGKPGGAPAGLVKKPDLPKPGAVVAKTDTGAKPGPPAAKSDAKPGATPAKPGATPAKPGVTPAKPDATPAKPGATPAKPGATPAKPALSAPVKPGSTPVKPGVGAPAKPGLTPVKPGLSTPVKPGLSTPAKPGLTPVKPGVGAPAKPGLTPVKPGVGAPAKPGLTPVKPGAGAPAKPGLTPVKPGLSTPAKPGLTPVKPGAGAPAKPGLTPVKPGAGAPAKPGLTPVKPGAGAPAKPTPVKPPGPKPGAPAAAKVDLKGKMTQRST